MHEDSQSAICARQDRRRPSYQARPSFGGFGFNLRYVHHQMGGAADGVNNVSVLGGIVDPFTVGAIPRWRHYATLTWNRGPWGATVAQNYTWVTPMGT